jgi:hypothetical protein
MIILSLFLGELLDLGKQFIVYCMSQSLNLDKGLLFQFATWNLASEGTLGVNERASSYGIKVILIFLKLCLVCVQFLYGWHFVLDTPLEVILVG